MCLKLGQIIKNVRQMGKIVRHYILLLGHFQIIIGQIL